MDLRRFTSAVLLALTLSHGGSAQPLSPEQADDAALRALIGRVHDAVLASSRTAYRALLSPNADQSRVDVFLDSEMQPGATRAVVLERDRQHLLGTLPGTGYRLLVDTFIEYGDRARIATWQLDVKKVADEWRIADQDGLSAFDNLYRLSVTATRQFRARDFKITAEDLDLTLIDGSVFTVDTDRGTTGLVLVGRGELTFEPAPETEKTQVRLFAGAEALRSRFDAAYIRFGELTRHADPAGLIEVPTIDVRELRRAEEIFREESPNSYALELGDLTPDLWSLAPSPGDFLADVRTQRFDTITYARTNILPEDISVFDRRRQRNISVYASAEQLASRGAFYNEDDLAAFDILDYDIDLAVAPTPERQSFEGRATMRLQIKSPLVTQLALRLADSLAVQSIVSDELGHLLSMRVRDKDTVLVNLPVPLARDEELTLTVNYQGTLAPQAPDSETLQPPQQRPRPGEADVVYVPTGEPSYLYSSRSYWYPQASISDYATAHIRLTVPASLSCVATGEMAPDSPVLLPADRGLPTRRQYEFTANRPVRYLAFIASRFVRGERLSVAFDDAPERDTEVGGGLAAGAGEPIWGRFDTLTLSVDANPLQVSRGRELIARAGDIARFYRGLIGDSPYPSFALAVTEDLVPGGHSPGYFSALSQPIPNTPLVWRNDPAHFDNYPDFFLAHELAHQWWGQAVGWQNYHEQWLSEAFAQYFAALYAEERYGPEQFAAMLRQLRRWAIDRSDQGPVYLGYRLGHIRNDSRVFRALVYNKGAAVLHMLRRLLGDEVFFRGLRRFYRESRFLKVGTEDFRRAMEAESNQPLERFFTRWIYGASLPQISFGYTVEGATSGELTAVLRFEQVGDLFDVPVSVTLQYADRRSVDLSIPVTERVVETRVRLDGPLRAAVISNDDGTLAEIGRN
jgi:hypothetical protein